MKNLSAGATVETPQGNPGVIVGRTSLGSWLVKYRTSGSVLPWREDDLTVVSTPAPRMARCTCGKVRESSPSLDFFQARGPGTQEDTCAICRFAPIAHEWTTDRVVAEPHPATVGHEFTPMTEGYEFDTFYCGCRGWD